MPYYPRKRAAKKGRKTSKYITARKAIRNAKKINFKKAVRSVISENAETKHAYTSSGNALTYFNSGINSSGDMLQVLPNIASGTADNQRIGDQLKGQKLNISGYVRLNYNSENLESQPRSAVLCRMMVLSMKNRNGIYADAIGASANLSALLKKGGTTSNFSGNLSDINAKINTDFFTVHHDSKFYLTQSYLVQPATAGLSTMSNDIKNAIKFFNIRIPCKKLLKYDSTAASGLQPVNWAPFLVLGYSYLDGSTPDVVGTEVAMQYNSDFTYEDV